MSQVRIKTPIGTGQFTQSAQKHIENKDMPESYSTDGKFIYKTISKEEYIEMVNSEEGVMMVELGLEAIIDEAS